MTNKIIKYYGTTLLCCLCVAVVAGDDTSTELNNKIAKLKEEFYKQLEYLKNPDLYNNDTSLNEHSRNLTELYSSMAKLREDFLRQQLINDTMPDFNIPYNGIIRFVEPDSNRKTFSIRKILLGILVVIKVILLIIRLCLYIGNKKNDDLNDTADHHDNVAYCTYPFLFVIISLSVAITIILIL